MLASLALCAALAAPPRVGIALGPAVGGGDSALGPYLTAAPAGALTVTWPFGPFEAWVGASASGLVGPYGDDLIPAALIQGELGLGVGGRGGSAGFYAGNGFPGPIAGFYGRVMLPGSGWARRMGVEGRLFQTAVTDSTGFALMFRVEPGRDRAEERRGARRSPPRRPPPGPPPPPPDAAPPPNAAAETPDAAPPPGEEPSTVIPVGGGAPTAPSSSAPPAAPPPPAEDAPAAPPPGDEPDAGGTHHDDPYGG